MRLIYLGEKHVENILPNGDDTFSHDHGVYDLTKVRRMVLGSKAFFLPIGQLLWVLHYDHPDEKRVLKAKIRHPLLVAKYRGKWAIVDGLHRLERYRRRGIRVIPVKLVTDDMLRKAYIGSVKTS